MVDRNGNIVNNYTYDEWGNITTSNETISNPFKYAGEVYDSETGLYYLRARYYDPTVGRFINEDTIEGQVTNPLSLNVYTYCGNSPVGYVDPSGHIPIAPLLAKAGANGAADFMTQLFMNYYFNSNTAGDIGASIGAVNWWQVARSTLEGLIPWKTPGGRLGRAAVTAVGDVLVNALYYGNDYSVEQALQDFGIGFIGDLAGGGLGELISKYGSKSVAIGLKKLGISDSQIVKLTGTGAIDSVTFTNAQLGEKFRKHKNQYNFNSYIDYKNYALDIYSHPDQIIFDSRYNEYYYIKGNDLLRLKPDGTFISLYPGADSDRVINAR